MKQPLSNMIKAAMLEKQKRKDRVNYGHTKAISEPVDKKKHVKRSSAFGVRG